MPSFTTFFDVSVVLLNIYMPAFNNLLSNNQVTKLAIRIPNHQVGKDHNLTHQAQVTFVT
jgi:hypothetical protein